MRVAIVGLGLMGGSLGLALRDHAGADVVGSDPDPLARDAALARGCVATAYETTAEACAGADLVVVCTPVAQLGGAIAEALASTSEAATVTDIGSTKGGIVRDLPAADRRRFVGGHPIAGAEARGAQNARAELLAGATYFLTPVADTDPARYARLHSLVAQIGARPVAIDPNAHDRLVALTSHLPHVLANLLATQAGEATIDGHDPLASAGGSFRDMTRVAGANARIWVDIFTENRDALLAVLDDHARRLDEVRAALASGDAGGIARWIGDAAQARRRALRHAYPEHADELFKVRVHLPDRPGAISAIAQALGAARINIDDFVLHHMSPDRGGVVELSVSGADNAARAVELLDVQGYAAIASPIVQGDAEVAQ